MNSRQSNHTRKKTRKSQSRPDGGLTKHYRVAERMEDLDDEALKAIAAAEVPAQFAYLDEIDLT